VGAVFEPLPTKGEGHRLREALGELQSQIPGA
jgi:hypothetical protein